MKHLQQHLADMNKWAVVTGGKTFELCDLTQEDCDGIVSTLNWQISPENLHCDGEISYEQAMAKLKIICATYRDLQTLCKSKGYLIKELED